MAALPVWQTRTRHACSSGLCDCNMPMARGQPAWAHTAVKFVGNVCETASCYPCRAMKSHDHPRLVKLSVANQEGRDKLFMCSCEDICESKCITAVTKTVHIPRWVRTRTMHVAVALSTVAPN